MAQKEAESHMSCSELEDNDYFVSSISESDDSVRDKDYIPADNLHITTTEEELESDASAYDGDVLPPSQPDRNNNKNKRKKFACPICHVVIYNLNRHLRDKHKCEQSYRDKYPDVIEKRKRKSKDKRRLKRCIVCQRYVYRYDHHVKTELHKKNSKKHASISNVNPEHVSNIPHGVETIEKKETDFSKPEENGDQEKMNTERSLIEMDGIYYKHLQTLGGGNCSKDCAEKHISSCSAILKLLKNPLDKCEQEINDIIDSKYRAQLWKPNTCKVYLNSMIKFIKFLVNSTTYGTLYNIPALESVKATLQHLCASLGNIARSARKARLKESSVKGDSDKVTPADLKCYVESKRQKGTVEFMAANPPLTRNNHTRCRNYLLMMVAIRNPHRTGALMNVTVTEFFEGRYKKNGGCHVILCRKHKTQGVYGPADIVIDEKLYNQIQQYRDNLRPKTSAAELFVTWNGKPLDSSTVINALSTELLHVGIEKKISCTQLRHLVATLVCAVSPEDAPELANYMCHSSSQQRGTYDDLITTSKSVRMSNIVHKILTDADLKIEDFDEASLEMPGYDISGLREKVKVVKEKTCCRPTVSMPSKGNCGEPSSDHCTVSLRSEACTWKTHPQPSTDVFDTSQDRSNSVNTTEEQEAMFTASEQDDSEDNDIFIKCQEAVESILQQDDLNSSGELPFKVTPSKIRMRMPEYEFRWLTEHLKHHNCKYYIPDLRSLYEEHGLLSTFVDAKWPGSVSPHVKIRRLKHILTNKRHE